MNPNQTRKQVDAGASKFLRWASRMQDTQRIVKSFAWLPFTMHTGERVWFKYFYIRYQVVYDKNSDCKVTKFRFTEEEYLKLVLDGTIIDGEWINHETNNGDS